MLDVDFSHEVTLRRPKAGTRSNATNVVWDQVLDDTNEPVVVPCRVTYGGAKNFSLKEAEAVSDATLLYRVDPPRKITRDMLVVDENGDAYKVLRFRRQDDLELDETYEQVELQLTDKTFVDTSDE